MLYNKEVLYDLFFKAASSTLLTFGMDPRFLGAQLGFIGILHTWAQNLSYHVHLHYIVAGGGISADASRWIHLPYREKFLFPVEAVSRVICAKFLQLLDKAYQAGRLQFPDSLACLSDPVAFEHFKYDIAMQEWYCYSKKPFAGPEDVVEYIGRYTHRIAISNYRLVDIDNDKITFTYHPDRERKITKEMTLPYDEFIRRFLLHIVPAGFKRIRYGGFLGSRIRTEKIETARTLLAAIADQFSSTNVAMDGLLSDYDPEERGRCPMCGKGVMTIIEMIPRDREALWLDSS